MRAAVAFESDRAAYSCLRDGERIALPSGVRVSSRDSAMPATLDQYRDLLTEKKPVAALATVMPDGTPQVTPVWFDFDGTRLRVNTAKGRVKARNMKEGSRVAL